MIDFWEALGRMANDRRVCDAFIDSLVLPRTIERETVKDKRGDRTGLNIPDGHYVGIQGFWRTRLHQGVVSIMAAGELDWTFSFGKPRDEIKKICEIVKQQGSAIESPTTAYFIGLGMLITDEYLRDAVKKPGGDGLLPTGLSGTERATLLRLAGLEDFDLVCARFCESPWDGSTQCHAAAVVWPGHRHVLAMSDPEEVATAKAKEAQAEQGLAAHA
jgi:hypothetical protein